MPAREFKHEYAMTRNQPGYAEIRCIVKNTSALPVTWGEWTCSWNTEWATDTRRVEPDGWSCFANFIKPVILVPGGTFTKIVPVVVVIPAQEGKR